MKRIEITEAGRDDRAVIEDMFQSYADDFTAFVDSIPRTEDGRYLMPDGTPTLDSYFSSADQHALLVTDSDRSVGFVLLDRQCLMDPASLVVAHFYISQEWRGKGVGTLAAAQVFDMFPGPWEVAVMQENLSAIRFWQAAISRYTRDSFRRLEPDGWSGPVFVFDNSGHPGGKEL
ncbi:MAG: GNAT family N-acetyltransferase [Gammaproteobacteria bacterium]|nr:GNAT family N-acetyltransferase [Gammaproteobacteria bacterium]